MNEFQPGNLATINIKQIVDLTINICPKRKEFAIHTNTHIHTHAYIQILITIYMKPSIFF